MDPGHHSQVCSPRDGDHPGVFYTGIPGYSLYAKSRDAGTGLMHRMMVYDMSRGYLNPRIIRADSGRLVMDKSKKFLVLKLYQGQSFENIQTQSYNTVSEPVPYMLPHFDYSETFIPFDANIKMQDEGELSSMYVGKNLHQLQVSIDSIRPILDSTRNSYARIVQSDLLTSHYGFSPYAYEDTTVFARQQERIATLVKETSGVKPEEAKASLTLTAQDSLQAIGSALDKAKRITEEARSIWVRTTQSSITTAPPSGVASQVHLPRLLYHLRPHRRQPRRHRTPWGDRDAYHHLHLLLRRLLHHRLLRHEHATQRVDTYLAGDVAE